MKVLVPCDISFIRITSTTQHTVFHSYQHFIYICMTGHSFHPPLIDVPYLDLWFMLTIPTGDFVFLCEIELKQNK